MLGIGEKILEKVYPIIFDYISKWGDIDTLVADGKLDYFFKTPNVSKDMLLSKKPKGDENDVEKLKERLSKVIEIFSTTNDNNFENSESVKNIIWSYAEQEGRGAVLWPLRVALSGQEKSPDPFTLASILGKAETISRIQKAMEILGK
jgi:glutamyl/glutaminyl-tRNA synthetase